MYRSPGFFYFMEKRILKKSKMKLRQGVKISYRASTADAEGGLKPRPLAAGVHRGLWAVSYQQAAEVYTEALLAPKPEIMPIIPEMPRISNEESGTIPFPIRHPVLR